MLLDQIITSKNTSTEKGNEIEENSEKAIRSIIKAISWRVVGTIDTVIISWLLIGDVSIAFTIGSVELVTKMLLYFFHERIWNKIKWGKQ